MTEPKAQVSMRLQPHIKQAGHELAERRGTTLSGMLEGMLREAIAGDRAEAAAWRRSERPVLGGTRNITTRMLTGACLHPIHLREQWGVRERCAGCGQDTGSIAAPGSIGYAEVTRSPVLQPTDE